MGVEVLSRISNTLSEQQKEREMEDCAGFYEGPSVWVSHSRSMRCTRTLLLRSSAYQQLRNDGVGVESTVTLDNIVERQGKVAY